MSKKKLSNDAPPVFHMDDIAVMSDDEVWSHLRAMENGRRTNRDPHPFEVEAAYLQRELGIRKVQNDAHAAWLQSAPPADDAEYGADDGDSFEVA